jgi:hypothetical protein
VVTVGGSYGGGFSWMAFTDPKWDSPGGTDMQLAAAAPKYGWSDLVFTHISARIPGPEHHFLHPERRYIKIGQAEINN